MKIRSLALLGSLFTALSLPTSAENTYFYKNKKEVSPVFTIEEGGEFTRVHRARSVMKRYEDKVCITVNAKDLNEGAYTGWWIIFNNPETCADSNDQLNAQCGAQDLNSAEAEVTGMWAAGALVGPKGKAIIDTCLEEFELTRNIMPFGAQTGLTNAKGAEIHFLLRYHGPTQLDDAEALGQQLNSYIGGCEIPDAGVEGFPCFEDKTIIH